MDERDAAVQTAIESTNVVETQEVNQTNGSCTWNCIRYGRIQTAA